MSVLQKPCLTRPPPGLCPHNTQYYFGTPLTDPTSTSVSLALAPHGALLTARSQYMFERDRGKVTFSKPQSPKVTKPQLESTSPPFHPNLERIHGSSARYPSIPPIIPSVEGHRVDIIGNDILHLRKNMTPPTATPALLSLRTRKTRLTFSLGEHLGQVSLSPGPYPTLEQYPGPHQLRQSFAPPCNASDFSPTRPPRLRARASAPAPRPGSHDPSAPPSPWGACPASLAPSPCSSLQFPLLPAPPPGPGLPRAPWGLSALPPARPSRPAPACPCAPYLLLPPGQLSPSLTQESRAERLAGCGAAMEAAARRRQRPGAADGQGAQSGASFLQARWARACGVQRHPVPAT